MLLIAAAVLAQEPLPSADGPLLLPVRTTNLTRGEAVAVDALFRAHLDQAIGGGLYPAEATRALVLQTGALSDPVAQCQAVACRRIWTIEVVRLGEAFHAEVIDRDPDGRVRLDLSATSADLDGLAPLARDLWAALDAGAPTSGWGAAMPATTAAVHAAGVVAPPPRSPHETITYGPLIGALGVAGIGEAVGGGRIGFLARFEREHWYLHGMSTISLDSLTVTTFAGVDIAYGGGWNGPGERANAFVGAGLGAGLYSFGVLSPSFYGYGEGGVAFLRNTTSRVYVTGRVAPTWDSGNGRFAVIAGLDVGAGF